MSEFEDSVVDALKSTGWNAKEISLGSYIAWHLFTETPAFRFDTLVHIPQGSRRLIVLRARSSFELSFASYLLSRATEEWLNCCPNEYISISPGFDLPGRRFDGVGLAPPAVAQCFASQAQILTDHSFWVYPVMKNDFRGDEDRSAFHFRLGKGGRIAIIDWNRDGSTSVNPKAEQAPQTTRA